MRSGERNPAAPMIALILIVLMFVAAQNAFAVDFKGVEIGEKLMISEERTAFGRLDCNPMQLSATEYARFVADMQESMPGVRKVCAATTSIATVPAAVTVLLGPARRVLRLTFQFDSESYERVVDAMTLKFGEGIVETRDANDESVWWDFEDGNVVSVHRMPVDDEDGAVDVTSVAMAEYAMPVASPSEDL